MERMRPVLQSGERRPVHIQAVLDRGTELAGVSTLVLVSSWCCGTS